MPFNPEVLFCDLPDHISMVDDPLAVGQFVRATAAQPAASHRWLLGRLPQVRRFTCVYRYDPWWVTPAVGTAVGSVPVGTQYLLAELADGRFLVLLPVLSGPFLTSIEGGGEDQLFLVAETGDPGSVAAEVTGLFWAVGDDPYTLLTTAAASVTAWMASGRLREDKPVPEFIDYFGWCTWDAFYQEVNHDKVRAGLQSFADGEVTPRFLILDDGWLSKRTLPTGDEQMTSFDADPVKFPGNLAATVSMAKGEFDIDTFLVWHTLQGYWGGVDGAALPYTVRATARNYPPTILQHVPKEINITGGIVGLVAPEESYRFYHDFYRALRLQGVDGVKVDNQGALDGLAAGLGGSAALMGTYHEALEGAAQTHFLGRQINCMSVSSNVVYHLLNSTLLRSFTDFWPNDPASHGLHLFANAQNSLWLGAFIQPDWDMFQSAHPMGAYHAAGRAISGGPVYVSDKPEAHNFDVLRKLVCSDGSILRALQPGLPTRDVLFANPTQQDVLLKIFTRNAHSGVVGVFNARYHAEEGERVTLDGVVRPADIAGFASAQYLVYAHNAGTMTRCGHTEAIPVRLAEGAFELFTIVPMVGEVVPVGLADKYNSGGAVSAHGLHPQGGYRVVLRDGGHFLAWCAHAPQAVTVADSPHAYHYDVLTGVLSMDILPQGVCEVVIG